MNRLVIIGNGFDLAHGLPTGYCDFIDWYWGRVLDTNHTDNFVEFKCEYVEFNTVKNFKGIQEQIAKNYRDRYQIKNEKKGLYYAITGIIGDYQEISILTYNNSFFGNINYKHDIQNWVDIENEYYKLLKNCLKEESNNKRVTKLNDEFEQVKKLLEQYIQEEVINKYDLNKLNAQIMSKFNLYNRCQHRNNFIQEFRTKEDEEYVNEWVEQYIQIKNLPYTRNFDNIKVSPSDLKVYNLFINFNYTPTLNLYLSYMNKSQRDDFGESEIIQIHGKTNDPIYPINFGFGDEMDDDYKAIEKKDDNEYLRNIKSFQYLQNSNYRNLLRYIDSTKFQVYIMGHSCGLSDRVLLNKIFEHENCCSIKVFYHKYDEPKPDGRTDDYTNIVQNISRHFNKKEMMRERIVNKTLCEPLPQIKLPLKQ